MNIKKISTNLLIAILLSITAIAWLSPPQVQAQSSQELACQGTGGTFSGGDCVSASGTTDLEGLILNVINIILAVIGIIAVLMIVIGGFRYVISLGDSAAIQGAKNTILYAVVGLVVAFVAYGLVNFVITGLLTSTSAPAPGTSTPPAGGAAPGGVTPPGTN